MKNLAVWRNIASLGVWNIGKGWKVGVGGQEWWRLELFRESCSALLKLEVAVEKKVMSLMKSGKSSCLQ